MMEYYSAIKKNETMPFAGKWIELEIIMLSETSQSQKENIACLLSYAESRPKIIILHHWGRTRGRGEGKERPTGGEYNKYHYIYTYIYMKIA
jgi:hypothetical protein